MYGSPLSKDLNLPILHPPQQPAAGVGTPPQMSSAGLLRYRSAPSTLLGEVSDDFIPAGAGAGQRPTSPDHAADTVLASFLADHHHEIRDKPPAPPHRPAVASHFPEDASSMATQQQLMCHSQQRQQQHMAAVEGLYRTVSSAGMDSAAAGGNSLLRQSSSPAGFLNHLNMDNGYGNMLRAGMGTGFRNGRTAAADSSAVGCPGRLKGQLSLSSRQGSVMSQISEMGSEELGGSSPEAGSAGAATRGYIRGYPMGSAWEEPSPPPLLSENLSGVKRPRDPSDATQNGLTQQFSMPKSSQEMAAIEKFLQFQDAVPCKIRAKRGCATHPRSIAERVRRTRISERIRKLQELVPNMEKQTNTSDMLDLAVDYIKDLQKQVKGLNDSRAHCTCSASKQKLFSG